MEGRTEQLAHICTYPLGNCVVRAVIDKSSQAGLFSAIVTAFTIVQYSTLQPAAGDISNKILAHLSSQIASFTVNSNLANSTVPALQLDDTVSSFTPPLFAAPITTLWVGSLLLSIFSAFFTLTVQQWLHHIPLPSGLSIRRAVQLHQLRHNSLEAWHVPEIISVLPLLLQAAVILFLVGMFLFLPGLDKVLAMIWNGAISLGLSIFLLFIGFSWQVDCPYKSPITPGLLLVAQTVRVCVMIWILGLPYVVISALHALGGAVGFLLPSAVVPGPMLRKLRTFLGGWITFDRLVEVELFWLTRESNYLIASAHKPPDNEGLIDALFSMRTEPFLRTLHHLQGNSGDYSLVVHSLRHTLKAVGLREKEICFPAILSQETALQIREWLSVRHYQFLQHLLSQTEEDFPLSDDLAIVLVCMHILEQTHCAPEERRFPAVVTGICDRQATLVFNQASLVQFRGRPRTGIMPACLMCQYFEGYNYHLNIKGKRISLYELTYCVLISLVLVID